MTKRLTYEEVKEYFEEQGCELLEKEYYRNNIKMKYRCNCGSISEISLNNFQKGRRCNKCGVARRSEYKRFVIEDVRKIFRDKGCELLEKKYKNCKTKMRYRCICMNISEISLSNFKNGRRCKKCGSKKISKIFIHSYKYIKSFFKKNNCTLLENEYFGCKFKMKYICKCGNESKINFNHFKRGERCNECGIKNRSGKNSPNYDHNKTDEERFKERKYPGYYRWRDNIYKRDNYTCQCCLKRGGKLNAHHIFNYSSHKKIRLYLSNGITLCETCHKSFHSIYGNKNNNSIQLVEFLSLYKESSDDKIVVRV